MDCQWRPDRGGGGGELGRVVSLIVCGALVCRQRKALGGRLGDSLNSIKRLARRSGRRPIVLQCGQFAMHEQPGPLLDERASKRERERAAERGIILE